MCGLRVPTLATWDLCSPWPANRQLLFPPKEQHRLDWTRWVLLLLLGLDVLPRAEESASHADIPGLPAPCFPQEHVYTYLSANKGLLRSSTPRSSQVDVTVNTESQPVSMLKETACGEKMTSRAEAAKRRGKTSPLAGWQLRGETEGTGETLKPMLEKRPPSVCPKGLQVAARM